MKVLSVDYSKRDFMCANVIRIKEREMIILETIEEDCMFINDDEVVNMCKEIAKNYNCEKIVINDKELVQ